MHHFGSKPRTFQAVAQGIAEEWRPAAAGGPLRHELAVPGGVGARAGQPAVLAQAGFVDIVAGALDTGPGGGDTALVLRRGLGA